MSTRELLKAIIDSVESVIVGKRQAVEMAVVALLCEGHVLVEDVPGIGKTTLCKAIARSIGCSFRRIQLTPDVLPSDVTGLYFFNQRSADFEFRPGPVFANLVLADEINRATPRTQSALLECMEERQVTVDGETRPLPRPFLVIATRTLSVGAPSAARGAVGPLSLKIEMGYPTEAEESEMVTASRRLTSGRVAAVASAAQLLELQRKTRTIHVDQSIRDYIVQVTRARSHSAVQLAVAPRNVGALSSPGSSPS